MVRVKEPSAVVTVVAVLPVISSGTRSSTVGSQPAPNTSTGPLWPLIWRTTFGSDQVCPSSLNPGVVSVICQSSFGSSGSVTSSA